MTVSFSRSQWNDFLTPGGGLVAAGEGAVSAESLIGERLGVFELAELIASGGMASVYRARRVDGVFEQSVAIKVVHAGLEKEAHRQRFLQERQILARLDHPGIARVFDGGVTEDDRPYLVMDLVEGASVDTWCADNDASLETRLELYLEILGAVQFAHGQLVVHCDIKPSNILIDPHDHPRLLDFGIAHVFASGLTDDEETDSPLRPFTPLYAAPEQLRGEDARVATDIWQLGLLLQELVSEAHPWRHLSTDLAQLTREILDGEPTPPGEQANPGARKRAQDSRWTELDAIVACCLEKEPANRYPSVTDLARDIRALMDHRPVQAVDGGSGYRLARLLRRNRPLVRGLAGVVIAMAALAWWGQTRVEEERDRADAMAAFVGAVVAPNDPLSGQFEATELISVSSFEPPPSVINDPVLQREFVLLSGRTLINLGRFESIIELVTPLAESLVSLPQPEDTRLAEYLSLLGYARFRSGEPAAGRTDLTRALELMNEPGWVDGATRLLTARRLAQLERSDGAPERAWTILESVLDPHDPDPETASAWLDMGLVAGEARQYEVAIDALEEAVKRSRDDRLKVASLAALSDAQRLAGRLKDANQRADQAVELAVELAGEDTPMRATALLARANVRRADKKLKAAIGDYRAALEGYRSSLGDDHEQIGRLSASLAATLVLDGRCPAAAPMFDEALRIGRLNGLATNDLDALAKQRRQCD